MECFVEAKMNSKKSKLIICILLCALILSMLLLSACGDKNNGLMSVKGRRFKCVGIDVMQHCSNERRSEIWNEMGLEGESEFNGWVIATESKNVNTVIEFKEDGTFAYLVFDLDNLIPEYSTKVEAGTYVQDRNVINCYTHDVSLAPTYVFHLWHAECVALIIREFDDADGAAEYVIVLDFEEIID